MLFHLHSYSYGLLVLWALQLAGATGLAAVLPRTWWPFKVLCAISAIADLGEMVVPNGTDAYALVYWSFRVIELNWAVVATCVACRRLVPMWRTAFCVPAVFAFTATFANGFPSSNRQMVIYQTFMLALIAMTALFAAGVGYGLRLGLLALAIGFTFALQLACTIIWRAVGYASAMWLMSWIVGLVLLWWSAHLPTDPDAPHRSPAPCPPG